MAVSADLSIKLKIKDLNGNPLVLPSPATNVSSQDEYAVFVGDYPSLDSFVDIPFGPVTTANLVVLKSTGELTVQLNGDADIIFPVKESLVLQSDTGITALAIKNFSGAEVTVEGYILGT